MFILVYITVKRARGGEIPFMRRLPALDAIEEVIGRAAEMGRLVHVSPGQGALTSQYGTETMVGLSVVNYAARIASKKGADILCTVVRPAVFPLAIEAVRNGFLVEGNVDKFNRDMIRYIPYGNAYDSAIMGIAERERPAANIIVGAYWHAALFIIETMNKVGAMSVGGTSRPVMTPFFIGGCDYFLIAEEGLAAGAYLSEDPIIKGSFRGQDYTKFIAIIIMILGVITLSFGINIIKQIIMW